MKCTLYRKDGRFVCYNDVISIHTDHIFAFGGVYIKVKYRKRFSFDNLSHLYDIYPSYEVDKIVIGGDNK